MLPYCKIASECGYSVLILEVNTPWAQNVTELAKRTIHGVPKEKIDLMKQKWESNVSVEAIVKKQPEKFKPESLTLSELESLSSPSEEEKVTEENKDYCLAVREKTSVNDDFQSLLQCFPDVSVDRLYLAFLQGNNNAERAINILLTDNDREEQASETKMEFQMQLDADFAGTLETIFGSVRNGTNFPGNVKFNCLVCFTF